MRVQRLIGAAVALMFGGAPALAIPPSVSLISGGRLVEPFNAYANYFTYSTTHTNGVLYSANAAPEIKALARALGGGSGNGATPSRLPVDDFAAQVFDYVRTNIRTEFRFGLGKGARGAAIDQSGTAFDQAELMVKILREGGVSASFKLGTITLNAAQFGKWTGLVHNLNETAQTFTVSAPAACAFLADGGIPATAINGSLICTSVTGNLSTVTMMHAWVEVNGKQYDPSFKQHILKAGLDLPSAMGCGTEASPTCGSQARTDMMNGAATGNYGSGNSAVPWVQNLNEGLLNIKLNQYATSLASTIKNSQERYAPLGHVIGGSFIDKGYNPPVGTLLPYPASVTTTWAGDIPDRYRTTLRIQFLGIDQTLYADEAFGKDLYVSTVGPVNSWTRSSGLYADNVLIGSIVQFTASTTTDDEVTLTVNHPYATNPAGGSPNGAFGDETQQLYAGEDPRNSNWEYVYTSGCCTAGMQGNWYNTITLVFSTGNTGPEYQSLYGRKPARTVPGLLSTVAANGPHRSNGAQFLVQNQLANEIVAGASRSAVNSHHVMGLVYSAYDSDSASATLNIVSSLSVTSKTSVAANRMAAFETLSIVGASMEGSVIRQAENGWDTFTGPALFKRANDAGQRFMRVTSSNWSTASTQLSQGGYDLDRRNNIKWFTDNQFQVIIPRNSSPGSVSISGGSIGMGPSAELAISTNTVGTNRMAVTVAERLKGSASVAAQDPMKGVLESVKQGEYSLRTRKAFSLDSVTGSVTLTPAPDISVGVGEFPKSLSFSRTYSSSSSDSLNCRNWSGGGYSVYALCEIDGEGSFQTRLRGGWRHNFEISAEWANNGLEGLGVTSALRASNAIADIYTAYDVVRSVSTANRLSASLAASLTAYHMINTFMKNTFAIHLPGSDQVFSKLPDGNFDSPINAPSAQIESNFAVSPAFMLGAAAVRYDYSNTTLAYKGPGGEQVTFINATGLVQGGSPGSYYRIVNPQFTASQWLAPDGSYATFNYVDVDNSTSGAFTRTLASVTNNLGRSLTFGMAPGDGLGIPRSINSVSDGTRSVSFTATDAMSSPDCPKPFTIGHPWTAPECPHLLTITGTDGGVTKYSYMNDVDSPNPAVTEGPGGVLRKWYTPSSDTQPYLTLKYDEMWHVKEAKDPLLNVTTLYTAGVSSEEEKFGEMVDATGASTRVYADKHGNPTIEVDALGAITTHEYNIARRRAKTAYPEGNYDLFAYDVRGNRTSTSRYPKPGSVLPFVTESSTYVEGPAVVTCSNLKICNQVKTQTDARGNVTTYEYLNATGQLQRVTGPALTAQAGGISGSSRTDLCYSTLGSISFLVGKVDRVSGSENRVSAFAYSGAPYYNLASATTDPATTYVPPVPGGGACTTASKSSALNLVTSVTYDGVGNVSTINGPRSGTGDTTTYYFDGARRLTGVLEPLGGRTRYCFDADGLLLGTHRARTIGLADPNVGTATTTGQCSASYSSGQWLSETRSYYATGDLLSATNANSHTTLYAYDAVGRTRVVQDPDGRQSATVYDPAGQVLALWKGGSGWLAGSGGATVVSGSAPTASTLWNSAGYTSAGHLRYAQYAYTLNGQKSWVRDANNNQTDYAYDGHGRLRFALFPDKSDGTRCVAPGSLEAASLSCSATQTYELSAYDSGGNLTSFRNRRGQTIGYEYDQLNRLAVRTPPDTGAVTFGMNLLGENLQVSRAASALNALHTTAYSYDAAGRKLSETTDGQTVSAAYDTLASAQDNAGSRTRTTWADGYYIAYGYDAQGRMSHVRENSTSAGELAYYKYDALSRREYLCLGGQSASCQGGGGTNKTSYGYDPAGQLSGLNQVLNGASVGFTFGRNPSGQITNLIVSDTPYLPTPAAASTIAYTPNKLNQYDSVGAQALAYDNSGNLISWTFNGVGQSYTYDSENRLLSAVSGGTTTSYEYDGLDRRVSKNVSGTVTRYVLDGDEEIAELNGSNGVLRRYIVGHGIDDRVARAEGASISNPTKYYYHVNHQGSVIAMSDATGNLQQQISYDEYGRSSAGATGEPYRYTGRRYDAETGLYYYRARYYTPELGRFLQVDPIAYEDDINLYAYVGNDPGNALDPTGNGKISVRTMKSFGLTIRNEALAGKRHSITKVPFDKNGFPIFNKWAKETVYIRKGFTGTSADARAANKLAKIEGGTPEGYTWHHHQDGHTMQLLPSKIHAETGHTGGVAISRTLNEIAKSLADPAVIASLFSVSAGLFLYTDAADICMGGDFRCSFIGEYSEGAGPKDQLSGSTSTTTVTGPRGAGSDGRPRGGVSTACARDPSCSVYYY